MMMIMVLFTYGNEISLQVRVRDLLKEGSEKRAWNIEK